MRNIRLTIQYDGTEYAGWQTQKNGRAIQQTIEEALAVITDGPVALIGSGRTDAGVHAYAQTANFKTASKIPADNLIMALNAALPDDIVVTHAVDVPLRFNSQHNAVSKTYRYTIVNAPFIDPFMLRFAAKCPYALDMKKMKKAARLITGRHDFRSFQRNDFTNLNKDTVRTIHRIALKRSGKVITIDVQADGFLYNMMRALAGMLVEVGRGKVAPETVLDVLAKKDRRVAGPTLPAKGLCLIKVQY